MSMCVWEDIYTAKSMSSLNTLYLEKKDWVWHKRQQCPSRSMSSKHYQPIDALK